MFAASALDIFGFVTDHLILSIVLALTLLYVGSEYWPGLGKNMPPAPWQFPIIGSLPFLALQPDKFFDKLKKRFGDVYRVFFGDRQVIILASYEAIKEAFITNGEIFSGRIQTFNFFSYLWSFRGIVMEDGWAWKEQRRFALSTLRDFGFGRFTMEDKILAEADKITVALKATKGAPTEIRPFLHYASANVICSVTIGKSFDFNDPEFVAIRETVVEAEKNFQFPIVSFIPWTRHVSEYLSGMTFGKIFRAELHRFTDKYITEHKETFDEKVMRDYLDCYLTEMYKRQKKNPEDVGTFDEVRLRSNLYLMFFAGVSTTSNTLNWAFRMLVAHPELQAELHEEIDRIVGADRQVSYADRTQMPRVEAFLCEVQRYGDITPLGVPHTNLEAVKLFGYDIPKRTVIMSNLRSVHQDPALWGDPENFRPSRFINEQGAMVRPDYLIPFGIGKRICMGEVLARMELFLLLTTLLQRFSFGSPDGANPVVLPVISFTRQLPEYKVRATLRSS